jgi:hypothetical protein
MTDMLGRPEAAPRRVFGDKAPAEVFRPEVEKEPPKERVADAAKECRRQARARFESRTLRGHPGGGPVVDPDLLPAGEGWDDVMLAATAYMLMRRSAKAPGRTLLEMRVEHILEDELAAAIGL